MVRINPTYFNILINYFSLTLKFKENGREEVF